MYLGIEIGGTKLQLGGGEPASTSLATLERFDIVARVRAQGILQQIEQQAPALIEQFKVETIGIGFGGPLDATQGIVTKSHQIQGWDNFPLGPWCQQQLARPTLLGNDCDVATLAEAALGAGKDCRSVFYVTVGTGVGGGFVVDGKGLKMSKSTGNMSLTPSALPVILLSSIRTPEPLLVHNVILSS